MWPTHQMLKLVCVCVCVPNAASVLKVYSHFCSSFYNTLLGTWQNFHLNPRINHIPQTNLSLYCSKTSVTDNTSERAQLLLRWRYFYSKPSRGCSVHQLGALPQFVCYQCLIKNECHKKGSFSSEASHKTLVCFMRSAINSDIKWVFDVKRTDIITNAGTQQWFQFIASPLFRCLRLPMCL